MGYILALLIMVARLSPLWHAHSRLVTTTRPSPRRAPLFCDLSSDWVFRLLCFFVLTFLPHNPPVFISCCVCRLLDHQVRERRMLLFRSSQTSITTFQNKGPSSSHTRIRLTHHTLTHTETDSQQIQAFQFSPVSI